MLNEDILSYMARSVLCWLATSSANNVPNVSPKEVFAPYDEQTVLIANIASPQTIRNIKENNQVCLSFIDVFVQKGYQLKGIAHIVDESHGEYDQMKRILENLTKGLFPFNSITKMTILQTKSIIAPRYWLYPETTEADQIESAKKAYGASLSQEL